MLTREQVKYAALDVLIAGQVYRGLRLWHSSPSPCAGCLQLLGSVCATGSQTVYVCEEEGCGKTFGEVRAYLSHATQLGHTAHWVECPACGRMHQSGRKQ